jgi:hypothetical protein
VNGLLKQFVNELILVYLIGDYTGIPVSGNDPIAVPEKLPRKHCTAD